MAAMYRLKGLGWLASCAIVAIGFYLVSSQVAAERKKLEQIDRKILSAERDIRALETEFDVRSNLAQLERWNGDTLALTVPTTQQFVADEATLASLSPREQMMPGGPPGSGTAVQTAALIVPATPSTGAPAAHAPAIQTASASRAVAVVKAAATRAPSAGAPIRLTPAVATAAGTSPARAMKAVAMLDKSLLSDSTLGDLLSGARAERGGLR
ncbi:hypothetical protein [Sphingomonas sp.]|jgi:hypothetical protein|uniref:hypothetical protein n=1 Tax=Sphingomonas sp. TaxID=28214 RepID=UPI0035C84858